MIKNYFKIAFRSFWRDRSYSVPNLIGLSFGLASVIMIAAYVQYEYSYDKHYSNSDRVYRIVKQETDAVNQLSVNVQTGTAEALKKEFPEIIAYTYLDKEEYEFKTPKGSIRIITIGASPDFFELFNFEFISGDSRRPLDGPHTMVITEKAAKRLFPGINPVGRTITDNYGETLKVTAVIKDVPTNTHIQGDAIISNKGANYTKATLESRGGLLLPQYIILKQGTDVDALAKKFGSFYKKYGFSKEKTLQLQPVTSIHLYSNIVDESSRNSDIRYIYIFSSAGILTLLIAVMNYINLITARGVQRTLEVGVRKVLGAMRKQLIFQFLSESFIFFFIALLTAVLLSKLLWPYFSGIIIGNDAEIELFTIFTLWILIGATLSGGLLAGLYPAFFLSGVKPVLSLKGTIKYSVNISFRKALVIFQFIISGVLIIATMVVQLQLNFIANSRLGFNKDYLITIPFRHGWHHNIKAFKSTLNRNRSIQGVTVGQVKIGDNVLDYSRKEQQDSVIKPQIKYIEVDVDFLRTMQMELVSGRGFSDRFSTDMVRTDTMLSDSKNPKKYDRFFRAKAIILNETAVKQLGIKDPVNRKLKKEAKGTVIGVVRDFNISTFYQKIPPVALRCIPDLGYGFLYIRISSKNIPHTVQFIKSAWDQFYPEEEFNFSFVDDNLQKIYTSEQRLGTLFSIFTTLAISIACLGLFGLITLTVQQRVKEIGIRKVLGAGVTNIVHLLSSDILKLVLIALVVAFPISWWLMDTWLQSFAYRIKIEWWVFIAAGSMGIIIAFVTISVQTIRAAVANPVKSLRSE